MNHEEILIDKEEDLNFIKKSSLNSPYVFIIPFRNQEKKIERCLKSILNQKNSLNIRFEMFLIDDASTDDSLNIVKDYLKDKTIEYTLISNVERKWKTRNLYNAGQTIMSEESIIVEFDGDDYVPSDVDLLRILNTEYQKGCLKTFGSFEVFSSDGRYSPYFTELTIFGIPHDTNHIWDNEKCINWAPLRSYKVKLFRKVPINCFLEKDTKEWLKLGEDEIIHPTMSELAGKEKISFIHDKIYVYDISGEEHDVNFINQKNYIAFKLLKTPKSILKDDPRKKFKTYEEACGFSEENTRSLKSSILKVTPLFSDFSNDSGITLWGTEWITYNDACSDPGCRPTRNSSGIPPVEILTFNEEKIGTGRLTGFLGSDGTDQGDHKYFMAIEAFFRSFNGKVYETDLSSNDFVKDFPAVGAKGIKLSMMVGIKCGQTYSITIVRSGIIGDDQFHVQISDKEISSETFMEIKFPFPKDGFDKILHKYGPQTEIFWSQPFWSSKAIPWGRKDFTRISIAPIVRGKGVDLYIKSIEFY